ncbi:MAG: hypothetical protein FWE08_04230 [Oscillospiraceae bacterium]|nr:hypothetical protein [Oscillospiraceae bacterium]
MHIDLTSQEFRLLLDMAYVGNWVLNSTRGEDRFTPYDDLEAKLFSHSIPAGMPELLEVHADGVSPSRAYVEGGIHEAIMDYEDAVFFEILAEELARRDMNNEPISGNNFKELTGRMDEYIAEFEQNGMDNISLG